MNTLSAGTVRMYSANRKNSRIPVKGKMEDFSLSL